MDLKTKPIVKILDPLVKPDHIAIIGASKVRGKQGNTAIRNLIHWGFKGQISPVNPAGGEIEELHCYSKIAAIPDRIDCAMIVIPAGGVVEMVRQCADAGVRSVIIGASGFAELGSEAGIQRQADITDIARASGLRILGPNTNGIFNATDRVSLGYNAVHGELIQAGEISIASHSGALFSGVFKNLKRMGIGLSKFVPVGNEADLDMLDFLEYFIEDDATKVIGLIVEGLPDGTRFRELAQRAQKAQKPIVALKVGRSDVGVQATLAHSSRLAGSAAAYDALFEECGVANVRSVEALAGGCAVLTGRKLEATKGDQSLICVTTSGAGGAVAVDFAADKNILLAGDGSGEWQEPITSALADLNTPARLRNPIDLGSVGGDWSLLPEVFNVLENNDLNGPTLVYGHIAPNPIMDENLVSALAKRQKLTGSPVVVAVPGGYIDDIEQDYRQHAIPLFYDVATCLESLNCHYTTLPGENASPAQDVLPNEISLPPEIGTLLEARAENSVVLSELESSDILRQLGVPIVESFIVNSIDEARNASNEVGFPVVLKAIVPNVAHKNQAGLVAANIANNKALSTAYALLVERTKNLKHVGKTNDLVVQKMVAAEIEVILGVSCEDPLGHFLILGSGGIFAELIDEVILLPIPVSAATIRSHLATSKLGRLLNEMNRDDERPVLDQIVDIALTLQRLTIKFDDKIEAIDINPVIVGSGRCLAVDAMIILKTEK
jgi:acetate---CoA ligase (ADP-forming)